MKYGPIFGRWMARRHLHVFRALPLVVACSSTLAKLLRNHGLEATVIRNGVDTSKYRPASSAQRAQVRAELNLAEGARVGVCVASLIALKNPLSIVRAVKSIDFPTLVMIFVGGGTLEQLSRREAQARERIRFAGHTDSVLRYLHAADFFVSASRSEGLPTAALKLLHVVFPLCCPISSRTGSSWIWCRPPERCSLWMMDLHYRRRFAALRYELRR